MEKKITVTQEHWDRAVKACGVETKPNYTCHCVIAQALADAGYEVLRTLYGGAATVKKNDKILKLQINGYKEAMLAFDTRNHKYALPVTLPVDITVIEDE